MVYSPENEICLIIYSTSCYSKPLWHSFFCRKYFEEYFHHTIKVMGLVQNNIGPQWHFSNDLMFHSRKVLPDLPDIWYGKEITTY